MKLWGETFTVGSNGSFTTPPLPASEKQAEIFIKSPGAFVFSSFVGPFISGNTPAFVEQMVVPPTSTNHAPSGSLSAKNTAQVATITCTSGEQMYFSLTSFDPDSADISKLSYTWSATLGSLTVLTGNTSANWTAMDSRGVATVSVLITDPAGATCKVHLRMLVSVQSMEETDTVSPDVVSRTPADGASGVLPESSITVVFSEELLKSSISTGAITATSQDTPVSGNSVLQEDGKTVIWTPTTRMPGNQTITVSLSSSIKDLYGNQLGTKPNWTFATALVPKISVNSLYTNDTTPLLTGQVEDPENTIQVTVNSKTYAVVVNGINWSAQVTDVLPDGVYDVKAVATNNLGIASNDTTNNELTIDTIPSDAVLSGLPPAVTSTTDIAVTVSGNNVAAYKYKLDALDWSGETAVSAKIIRNSLAFGMHELKVIGKDLAGNWQSETSTASHTWNIDNTVKTAVLATESLPLNPTNQTTTEIIVGGTGVTRYRFKLANSTVWSGETLKSVPIKLSGLFAGQQEIQVIGGDDIGNWQSPNSPTTFNWFIDPNANVAVLSDKPTNPSKVASATIIVGGTGVDTYKYRLDSGTWGAETASSTPIELTGLSDALHTIRVIAKDSRGAWQLESNATTYSWTVDTVVPAATFTTSVANLTNANPIPVTITFSETVTDFALGSLTRGNCTLDNLAPAAASGKIWTFNAIPDIASGVITLDLAADKVNDTASNTNAAATQFSVTYDGIVPAATFTTTVSDPTNATTIPVTITFSETVTGFTGADLSVSSNATKGALDPATSTGKIWDIVLTPTQDGQVTLDLNANLVKDAAGNGNASSTQLNIKYDNSKPVASITYSIPGPYKNGTSVTITATFNEAMSSDPTHTPQIKFGGKATPAEYPMVASTTSSAVYTFNYTVSGADGDATVSLLNGQDLLGNIVTETPVSGAIFVIDNTAPTNQNTVLSAPVTAMGGTKVIINTNDASNVIWLAPESTVTFAVNPNTMTNASGTAASITAPLEAGDYKIFVMDAAGNVSAPSNAAVTVNNSKPTHQNIVLANSVAVKSGVDVTIVPSDPSYIVWLAPFGTTSFVESTTKTKAVNAATSIKSPANAGDYKLYVINAVGNYSDPSIATVTVDNTKPDNENIVLAASKSVKGGVGVTIVSSGNASNSVWLAPAGKTLPEQFIAGSTMTKATNGSTTSILSPTAEGPYKLYVIDAAGNVSQASNATITVDDTQPTVDITCVPIGPYKGKQTMLITASYSENISDLPVPQIAITAPVGLLATNMTKVNATRYTYYLDIDDISNGVATITLPTGYDMASNTVNPVPTSGANITIDNASPTASITYDKTGPYKQGDTVVITATFNEDMATSPIPQISISGANTLAAANMTKVSATEYTYSHTVGNGNGDASISLSGKDIAGNNVNPIPDSGVTFTVDSIPPTASIVYTPAGPYTLGETVLITATFDDGMADSPIPQISISGANTQTATNTTKFSETEYRYWHTVGAGNGVSSILLVTGKDKAGNNVNPIPAIGATFTIDAIAPTASITYDPTGPYKPGDPVLITATFDKTMADLPVPQISISGANTLAAANMTKDSTTVYTYPYVVDAGNGVASISLLTGEDMVGNLVIATPTSGISFSVDNTSPTASITYTPTGPYKPNDTVLITATFNEDMAALPLPQVTIAGSNTQTATNTTRVSAKIYTYSHTVGDGNGTADITLSAGTDLVGNIVDLAPTSGGSFEVDNASPTAAITYDKTGPYKQNDVVLITATFNENMAASPVPQISISGANTRTAINMNYVSATEYTYSHTVAAGNGVASISLLTGKDMAGNLVIATPTSGVSFDVDNTKPTADITYAPTGPYKLGETVVITATYNENMADSPIPQISISGANTQTAANMTKDSETVYTYPHIVVAGNGAASISLATGKDLAGNDVTSIPTSGVTFTVDATPPTASIVYTPTGPYKQGDPVLITATFNETMAALPVPQISISGANTLAADDMDYVSATEYRYPYIVDAGNGIASISLLTGTDDGGNLVIATPTSGVSFTVDNTLPTAAITYSPTGPYKQNDVVVITATFNEDMAASPLPKISISGENTLAATNMTKTSSTVYTYSHTVGAGDGTANIELSTGTDLAGNIVNTAPTSGGSFGVDNTRPTAAVTYAPTGPYKLGDTVVITATFDENMAASPVPQISISGANTRTAINMNYVSATKYTYSHTVAAGNGVASISLLTGKDMVGNLVIATPTSGVSFDVDNTKPTADITYAPTGPYKLGDPVVITATYNENMADSPIPQISISGANTLAATNMASTSANVYTYSYTVGAGSGSANISLVTGKDLAGNDVNSIPTSGVTFTVDAIAPTVLNVTTTALDDSYGINSTIDIKVKFSKTVSVTGIPTLTLNTGIPGRTINYFSGSNTDTLTFRYTVQTDENSDDLDYSSTNALATPTATIKDSTGNNAVLTLPQPGTAGSLSDGNAIVIDTIAPVVSFVSSPSPDNLVYGTGTSIKVEVHFSEKVWVYNFGTAPTLELDTSGPDGTAAFNVATNGSDTLAFDYTVKLGDNSTDLDYIADPLSLNGSLIEDEAGNSVAVTPVFPVPGAPGSLGANKNLKVSGL